MKIRQFFYTLLKKGDKKMGFFEGEKSFLFPLFQKCIIKSKRQQQKIWNLVFSFLFLDLCIWFQYKNMKITGSHTFCKCMCMKKGMLLQNKIFLTTAERTWNFNMHLLHFTQFSIETPNAHKSKLSQI